MTVNELKEEIRNNTVRSLYLFYGSEEYLKKLYLGYIEDKVLDKGTKTIDKVVMEGKADIGRLIDNCETMPMLSRKRLVIVKDSGLFKTKKTPDKTDMRKGSGGKGDLTAYFANLPQHTCLIFYESEIDGRLKLIDEIKKKGAVVEFARQKPQDLVNWVAITFKSMGKKIEPAAVSYMVDASDLDMSSIMGEINKVAAYAGSKDKISLSDVKKVCSRSLKSRIFDLTDAIAEKNGLQAVKILNELIFLKEPVQRILYMIARQFRQVLEMKLMKKQGISSGEAAGRLGVTPYAAGKISRQTDKFSAVSLKKALETCLELDEAIKTGRVEDKAAVEILIAMFSN